MPFCSSCGNECSKEAVFCGKCGSKLSKEREKIICSKCGKEIQEDDVLFCDYCGTRINRNSNSEITRNQTVEKPKVDSEQVLYTKNLIGYYIRFTQITGTFTLTNKQIKYKPSLIYAFKEPFSINMNEISLAHRKSVMGLNYCINVVTTIGKEYLFGFGVNNASDIDYVIELINKYKS